VGLSGNVAAAVYFERTAESFSAASAAFAANNTADANNFLVLGVQQNQLALSTQSVQSFCEVAVLLLIIVAFAVVGAACARRISSAMVDMPDASAAAAGKQMQLSIVSKAAGRRMRLRIVGTAAFVFVTFLLRAVYSTMFALANELQNSGNVVNCPNSSQCDASCYNVYALMQIWLFNTPEFQLMVVLISSPLAMIVALWGMTTNRMLQLMKSSGRQMGGMRDVLTGPSPPHSNPQRPTPSQ
jgi:hypothetical protein